MIVMNDRSQRGIALIDVLLALLVLGVGALSVMPLLALVAHSNSSAWQRTVAAQLAQEKLEDLRSFSQLEAGASGVFGFDEIRSNGGGAEQADGRLLLAAGEQMRSGTEHRLSWGVSELDTCTADAGLAAMPCAQHWRASLKTVTVLVEWTDEWGDVQRHERQADLAALDPAVAALSLLRRSQMLPPRQTPP